MSLRKAKRRSNPHRDEPLHARQAGHCLLASLLPITRSARPPGDRRDRRGGRPTPWDVTARGTRPPGLARCGGRQSKQEFQRRSAADERRCTRMGLGRVYRHGSSGAVLRLPAMTSKPDPGRSACIGVHLLLICVKILACFAASRRVPPCCGSVSRNTAVSPWRFSNASRCNPGPPSNRLLTKRSRDCSRSLISITAISRTVATEW